MESTIRILSIDPAISEAGWSILDYEIKSKNVTVYKFGSIMPNKAVSRVDRRDDVEKFGKRLMALGVFEDELRVVLEVFKPNYVVVESAFFDPRKPNAYVALVQCYYVIQKLTYQVCHMPIYSVAPKAAKLALTGDGTSVKDNIQECVLSSNKIVFKQKKQALAITEHEADSIAIGHGFIVNILPGIIQDIKTEETK